MLSRAQVFQMSLVLATFSKLENLQGFTFVRNGRTIIIGNMHNAENYGFYNGINLPSQTSKVPIRIKIEYETTSGSRLDTVFRILPNKNGYEEISEDVWAAINKILLNNIDGIATKNFHPHNKIGPFYKPRDKSRHWVGDRIGIPKHCEICKTVIHEKDKTCPRAPCKVCSEPMDKYSCSTSKCMYKCKICSNTGHLESDCPTKKCPGCGEKATPPNCACYCVGCGELNENCSCPDPTCEECGELEKDCTCPPEGAFNIPYPTGDEDDNYGRQYLVDFWPGHKESTIKIIKDMMELAKIDKKDL